MTWPNEQLFCYRLRAETRAISKIRVIQRFIRFALVCCWYLCRTNIYRAESNFHSTKSYCIHTSQTTRPVFSSSYYDWKVLVLCSMIIIVIRDCNSISNLLLALEAIHLKSLHSLFRPAAPAAAWFIPLICYLCVEHVTTLWPLAVAWMPHRTRTAKGWHGAARIAFEGFCFCLSFPVLNQPPHLQFCLRRIK